MSFENLKVCYTFIANVLPRCKGIYCVKILLYYCVCRSSLKKEETLIALIVIYNMISKQICNKNITLFQYLTGFGSEFATEDPRCPGSLPEGQVCTITDLLLSKFLLAETVNLKDIISELFFLKKSMM